MDHGDPSILLMRSLAQTHIRNGYRKIRVLIAASRDLFRYQRGYVYLTGKKVKVWYGMFREDVRTPEGQVKRRQRHVRLGTRGELPTRSAARTRLAELFRSSTPIMEMNFRELVERWQKAVGPTMKATTLGHYRNALRAYVSPNIHRSDDLEYQPGGYPGATCGTSEEVQSQCASQHESRA